VQILKPNTNAQGLSLLSEEEEEEMLFIGIQMEDQV